jgi:hypothetical protein
MSFPDEKCYFTTSGMISFRAFVRRKAMPKTTGTKMKISALIKPDLIAPCGLNCATCSGYLKRENYCAGCVPGGADMPGYCKACIIRNCGTRKKAKRRFCFDCENYPCARMKRLDKRYRTRYGVSLLDNLESIRRAGIRAFVRAEREKWTCRECGGILCVHKKKCLFCGTEKPATHPTPAPAP